MEHRMFHMNIIDMQQFEDKLRAAEQRLGVGMGGGVPVVYERSSETSKVLVYLIVASILLLLLSSLSFKITRNVGSFVSFT